MLTLASNSWSSTSTGVVEAPCQVAGEPLGGGVVRAVEHGHELVAADAIGVWAEHPGDPLRCSDEQAVAHAVSERVVEPLEVVHVDERQ